MRNNPKVTVALIFFVTFLIGFGSGFFTRGAFQPEPGLQDWRTVEETEFRASEIDRIARGERGSDFRDRRETRPADRGFGRMQQGIRDEGERRDELSDRLRRRLIDELNLSDETAEEFFSVLMNHRRQVRERLVHNQMAAQEELEQLAGELEKDLAQVLNEQQMQYWLQEHAPRFGQRSSPNPRY